MEKDEFIPREHLFDDERERYDTLEKRLEQYREETERMGKMLRKLKARARARWDRGVGPGFGQRELPGIVRVTEEDLW